MIMSKSSLIPTSRRGNAMDRQRNCFRSLNSSSSYQTRWSLSENPQRRNDCNPRWRKFARNYLSRHKHPHDDCRALRRTPATRNSPAGQNGFANRDALWSGVRKLTFAIDGLVGAGLKPAPTFRFAYGRRSIGRNGLTNKFPNSYTTRAFHSGRDSASAKAGARSLPRKRKASGQRS